MEDVYYAVRLYRCKQTLFHANSWKETWLQLKTDGSLIWYNDKQCTKSSGVLNFNHVAVHIKIGDVARRKLSKICPKLPFDYSESSCMMAIPERKTARGSPSGGDNAKWFWFCFKCEKDLLITLQHFAKFFDYKRAFEECFEIEETCDDSAMIVKYHRYGIPMSGEVYCSSNGNRIDWGLLWEKFMMEIAPNKFLRKRRHCVKKLSPIEMAVTKKSDDFDEIERKDSCIDSESNLSGCTESYCASSDFSSQRESEDLGIPNSSDESSEESNETILRRKSEITVEVHNCFH